MFERYSEEARRVIFFAHYEASQSGSPLIQVPHILLGLLRQDELLLSRFCEISAADLRKNVERRLIKKTDNSSSTGSPFSPPAKRVINYTQEEADRLQHKNILLEHILLGLLR